MSFLISSNFLIFEVNFKYIFHSKPPCQSAGRAGVFDVLVTRTSRRIEPRSEQQEEGLYGDTTGA